MAANRIKNMRFILNPQNSPGIPSLDHINSSELYKAERRENPLEFGKRLKGVWLATALIQSFRTNSTTHLDFKRRLSNSSPSSNHWRLCSCSIKVSAMLPRGGHETKSGAAGNSSSGSGSFGLGGSSDFLIQLKSTIFLKP